MLLVKTKVQPSSIHGLGLFADELIPEGTLVYRCVPGFDRRFTREEILSLPKEAQIYLCTYSWKSMKTGLYCMSVDNDRFLNHSGTPNTRSEHRETEEEVLTFSDRDIQKGEEITTNYFSFEDPHDKDNLLVELSEKFGLGNQLHVLPQLELAKV